VAHEHDHDHAARTRPLALALALTAGFAVAEVAVGLVAGSLAVLADAAHMVSDVLSLGLALGAAWLAARPSTAQRTFGFRRAEILAALANGVVLVAVSIWIFVAAVGRLSDPPEVVGGAVLAIALVGLTVNLVAAAVLFGGKEASLNVSAALRHVLADAAGSVGVLVAGIVILTTGWRYADPLAGMLIALLVLASSYSILRDSTRILLEAAPRGIDVDRIGRRMIEVPGVREVHDLHVWTITSGFPALAAHVLVGRDEDCHARRHELERVLREEFELEHTTLQVDHDSERELIELELPQERSRPTPGTKRPTRRA
jgi:cobalt-zinc-cadmium efflux system protein